ncbi:hypothetical protein E2C01_007325 [Portunus trituberculatus]|uniref:Uncharacterized protein n=1 Tax=Portunus trituberculatus TaxID=210409 RepID=A0A5B7CXL0_PORTR|nr:hypothetical protein [Portunus trituberculatus]
MNHSYQPVYMLSSGRDTDTSQRGMDRQWRELPINHPSHHTRGSGTYSHTQPHTLCTSSQLAWRYSPWSRVERLLHS